jgi:hypothetical protein
MKRTDVPETRATIWPRSQEFTAHGYDCADPTRVALSDLSDGSGQSLDCANCGEPLATFSRENDTEGRAILHTDGDL